MFDNIPDQPATWAQQNQKRIHAKLQPKDDKFPAELEREKAARKAAAMTWIPNGYGSANGTSFIIEEIGEVDEDSKFTVNTSKRH